MKQKKAFTLSEALASLLIIGVITTLTVPPIQQNVTRQTNAQSLRKALGVLNSTIETSLIKSEFRPNPNCYYDESNNNNLIYSQCDDLYKYIKERLSIIKDCSNSSGCFPDGNNKYKTISKATETGKGAITTATESCNAFNTMNEITRKAFVLKNGMIIFQSDNAAILAVDVNGKKGPNKWGGDLFTIVLKGKHGTLPTYQPGGCSKYEKGGIDSVTLLEEY